MIGILKKILMFFAALMFIFIITTACSTRKNSWINRTYHEVVSYYNIYWNGDNTYKELQKKVEELDHDDFSKVLTVYQFGEPSDTSSTSSLINRMLEKGTKIIGKHSMVFSGEENIKTARRAYFMLGVAYLYKHDYSTARTFFNYAASTFAKTTLKYDAWLWSAKAYLAEDAFDMAITLLSQLKNNENLLAKDTKKEFPLVFADYYIRQEKYAEALPYLKSALEINKGVDLCNRIRFIIAQIDQKQGKNREAFFVYKTILQKNPNLKIDFNSRLNLALCYDANLNNANSIIRDVEKLLNDKKHEKYFGRIYYIIAEIKLKDNKLDDAIAYLEKSVQYASADKTQLAISAIRLADLYFDDKKYGDAELYYKKALENIAENYPNYETVKIRATNLAKLVNYLNIVEYEEIMQKLASLPEKDRDREIDRLIAKYKKEEAEKLARLAVAPISTSTTTSSAINAWYFYNETTKAKGFGDFINKWGQRQNEDYWFLNNKPNMSTFRLNSDSEEEEESEEKAKDSIFTPDEREYYLANMTDTPPKKEKSDERLEENKFMLGIGYFNLVDEAALGIKELEDVLKKFPDTKYKLQVYHYLYRMYASLDDDAKADIYKNLLIQNFPDSEQTKQILDPDYAKKLLANRLDASNLYEYTFEAYSLGAYQAVLTNVKEAEQRYSGNALMPKYKFLEAMASGNVMGVDTMRINLQSFIANFPEETVLVTKAKEILEGLKSLSPTEENLTENKSDNSSKTVDNKEIDISMFNYNFNSQHLCIIIVKDKNYKESFVKLRLNDFHRRSFKDAKLQINSDNIGKQTLLSITSFDDAAQAVVYANSLSESTYVFGQFQSSEKFILAISIENFAILKRLDNLDAYNVFYQNNY